MLNVKVGQVLKGKLGAYEATVINVLETGCTVVLKHGPYVYFYTNDEIHERFYMPKEKWLPVNNENYWLVYTDGDIGSSVWHGDTVDKQRLAFGNCFPTRELALAAAEKIKKLLLE